MKLSSLQESSLSTTCWDPCGTSSHTRVHLATALLYKVQFRPVSRVGTKCWPLSLHLLSMYVLFYTASVPPPTKFTPGLIVPPFFSCTAQRAHHPEAPARARGARTPFTMQGGLPPACQVQRCLQARGQGARRYAPPSSSPHPPTSKSGFTNTVFNRGAMEYFFASSRLMFGAGKSFDEKHLKVARCRGKAGESVICISELGFHQC